MNRPAPAPGGLARPLGKLLLAALLVAGLPADAQTITVTSAVPAETEQGTLGLVVAIGGAGFDRGSKVAFYVTGTTNPGGVVVKSVKYRNAKSLEATIDVAPDAQVQLKFDVQVQSGTRTGKGTELFRVIEKVTGGEIPPGSATNLVVIPGEYASVRFSFTLPADDGYDASSGPIHSGMFSIRRGESAETPGCGPHTAASATAESWEDPCFVLEDLGVPTGDPGSTATVPFPTFLAPNTTYYVMVRVWDTTGRGGRGLQSALENDLANQVSFTTGDAPVTPWTSEVIDSCPPLTPSSSCSFIAPALDLDQVGSPAIRYMQTGQSSSFLLASPGESGWSIEPVWSGIDTRAQGFALDPFGNPTMSRASQSGSKFDLRFYRRTGATSDAWETEVVVAGAVGDAKGRPLAFDDVNGTPAITYTQTKGSLVTLRIAEKRGASWTSQDVAKLSATSTSSYHSLVFNGGDPAIAFRNSEANGSTFAAFAIREGGIWHSEVIADSTTIGAGWTNYGPLIAFDPTRGNFAAVVRAGRFAENNVYESRVYYCERDSSGTWSCSAVPTCDAGERAWDISLVIRPNGTAHLLHGDGYGGFVSTRTPSTDGTPGAWSKELVGWGLNDVSDLRIAPDGRLVVALATSHDETGMGSTSSLWFASRPAPSP